MASEPETLFSDEPLKARTERHNYDRLLMLSDGVFAIAITLLALELRLPEGWDGSIEILMSATGRPLIGYLFGFGLVGVFWFMHRRLFAELVQVDPGVTIFNLLLLGLVGLTPYVARMFAEAGPNRAMPFYLVAVASVLGSLALIRAWVALRPKLRHPQADSRRWRNAMIFNGFAAAGLGALGCWAIVEHRPVSGAAMLVLVVFLAAGRRLTLGKRRA
jgi:uncharacterized membrane protein